MISLLHCVPPPRVKSSVTTYLSPFTLTYPPPSSLWGSPYYSVSLSFSLFVSFVHLLLLFYIPDMGDSMWFLIFSVWLILLSMTFSWSIHVVTNDSISSFLMAEWYSMVYMSHICFIQSSVEGHFGCFQNLATMNNAAVNIGVHESVDKCF